MLSVLHKIAITTFVAGFFLLFVAAMVQTVFQNQGLADCFGFTGLGLIACTFFVGAHAFLRLVWKA